MSLITSDWVELVIICSGLLRFLLLINTIHWRFRLLIFLGVSFYLTKPFVVFLHFLIIFYDKLNLHYSYPVYTLFFGSLLKKLSIKFKSSISEVVLMALSMGYDFGSVWHLEEFQQRWWYNTSLATTSSAWLI